MHMPHRIQQLGKLFKILYWSNTWEVTNVILFDWLRIFMMNGLQLKQGSFDFGLSFYLYFIIKKTSRYMQVLVID